MEILKSEPKLKTQSYVYTVKGVARITQKWVLNSAEPYSIERQLHYLAKHLATEDNIHIPPRYDYSHYITKVIN